VVHVESGAQLAIHGDQRFSMASVYKLPIPLELFAPAAEARSRWTVRWRLDRATFVRAERCRDVTLAERSR